MSKSSTTRRDAHTARVVLRMIDGRRHTSAASARERVMAMMADLDVVLLNLPEDPPDDLIQEVERIVVTLRTADESLSQGDSGSGMQMLGLAKSRLDRLASRMTPPAEDDESESTPAEPTPEGEHRSNPDRVPTVD
ncbi:MAG: hypothetical protein NXI31_09660 [bacterium]|nr:hypothetical protein [bacterium]